MDREKIISCIKSDKTAEIAELQKRYNITYREAKGIVDELLEQGELVYTGGVTYNYVAKPEVPKAKSAFERYLFDHERSRHLREEMLEREEKKPYRNLDELLEYYRKRDSNMDSAEENADDEDNDDDDDDDEEDDDGINYAQMSDEEIRQRALDFCIDKGMASVSLLQRTFPIGYIKAYEIINWMETEGYITSRKGPFGHAVVITREEYEKKRLAEANGDADKPQPAEEEEKFKEQAQKLNELIKKIKEKKKAPVSEDVKPPHHLWPDDDEFEEAVMSRMKRLITSDRKMSRTAAVKKAEAYLEAVRDTHDRRMVQLYERLVYDLKNTSNYMYSQLKKKFFE